MRYNEIKEPPVPSVVKKMSDMERHEWLEFIYGWLSGKYMIGKHVGVSSNEDALHKWEQFSKLFPPKIPSSVRLFRVVTVPIEYAEKQYLRFKPAPGAVSSWSKTLIGLDAAAGVANELDSQKNNARVGVEANIPKELILATPITIRNAFMGMSHDYFERYPEQTVRTSSGALKTIWKDFPGGIDSDLDMYEIGYLRDVLNRSGGNLRQYEYIVKTPKIIDATIVQIYRIGNNNIRTGNDDPHAAPTKIKRKKFK